MGTTADKLNKLLETKAAIKQAIIDKGVEVADTDTFASYPAKIDAIQVGGGTDEFLATRTLDGTNMSYLFYCYPGNTLDVSNLNTSNVRSMNKMFAACILTELDLSNFNTGNVNYMTDMFSGCMRLEKLNLSNFTAAYLNMSGMFSGCNNLREIRLDNCSNDTINKIITSEEFPTEAIDGVQRKIYVNPDNIGDLEAPENWIFVDLDGNEIVPSYEPTVYVEGEFEGNRDITEVNVLVTAKNTNLNSMFSDCENLTTIYNIDKWDTSKVTDMSDMFHGCRKLERLDLSNFDMSNVENVDGMFRDCDNLRSLRLDNFDYKTINKIINYTSLPTGTVPVDGEAVSRLMYVQEANIRNPENKEETLSIPNGWIFIAVVTESPTTYVSDPKEFEGNRDITEVNVSVTKEHTDLGGMFSDCENLVAIHNIDAWETGNVEYMGSMFSGCRRLRELDLSSFITNSVTDMRNMFNSCEKLEYLGLSNFDMGSVGNRDGMFGGCDKLHTLRLDNCNRDTIDKIINSSDFPTGTINEVTRKIYVAQKNIEGLEAPENWEFVYIVQE